VISVSEEKELALFSLIIAFIVILILIKTRPLFSLFAGIILSAVVFLLFSYRFIYSARWIDPQIPALTVLGGAFCSTLCAFTAYKKMASRLRGNFGQVMSASMLRALIKTDKPLPEKGKTVFAAIVAVRNPEIASTQSHQNPRKAEDAVEKFRAEVRAAFLKKGGIILSATNDTLLIVFGSPLERLALSVSIHGRKKRKPYNDSINAETAASRAGDIIAKLPPEGAKSAPWCFGLDYGECSFDWSPLSFYSAYGKPVVRARILSRLCIRYKVKALATSAAKSKIENSSIKEVVIKASEKTKKDDDPDSFFEVVQ
jgi:hypothetical protein